MLCAHVAPQGLRAPVRVALGLWGLRVPELTACGQFARARPAVSPFSCSSTSPFQCVSGIYLQSSSSLSHAQPNFDNCLHRNIFKIPQRRGVSIPFLLRPGCDTKLTRGCARQLSAGPSTHKSGFNAQDATVARGVCVSALLRAPHPEGRPAPASSRLALLWQREPQQSSRAQPGSRCPSNRPGCVQRRLVWFHVSLGAVCGGGGGSHLTRRREAVTLTSGRPLLAKWGQCWPLKDP